MTSRYIFDWKVKNPFYQSNELFDHKRPFHPPLAFHLSSARIVVFREHAGECRSTTDRQQVKVYFFFAVISKFLILVKTVFKSLTRKLSQLLEHVTMLFKIPEFSSQTTSRHGNLSRDYEPRLQNTNYNSTSYLE